jgi:hypothetical protein
MKYSNNKQLFLCSSRNFFGGMQFKKVKLEHGADGVLLYFPDVQAIAQLGRKFSATKYRFTITTGTSVSSSFLMLDVCCSTCQNFSVNLCTDILPDNLPFELSYLKFVLSKRDVKAIVTNEDCDTVRTKLLETNFLDAVRKAHMNIHYNVRERTYVLVGQAILDGLSLHEHGGLHIGYDWRFQYSGNYDELCLDLRYQLKHQLGGPEAGSEPAKLVTELESELNNDVCWEHRPFVEFYRGTAYCCNFAGACFRHSRYLCTYRRAVGLRAS